MATISPENDYTVKIVELRDDDDSIINGANVNMTLLESNKSSNVSGVSWPISLSDQGLGTYSGNFPNNTNINTKKTYYLKVVASFSGKKRTWIEPVFVREDTF